MITAVKRNIAKIKDDSFFSMGPSLEMIFRRSQTFHSCFFLLDSKKEYFIEM